MKYLCMAVNVSTNSVTLLSEKRFRKKVLSGPSWTRSVCMPVMLISGIEYSWTDPSQVNTLCGTDLCLI